MSNDKSTKRIILGAALLGSLLLSGCEKKTAPPSAAASAGNPVAQATMTAWQQGDKSAAVTSFLEADWSARPLFASGSTLSLTEDQFKVLSDADRQARSGEMMKQLDALKQVAAAVAQTGRDAASKGDAAQARKCFTSLKQCGAALSGQDCLSIVQLVGKAVNKMADTELAKMPQ